MSSAAFWRRCCTTPWAPPCSRPSLLATLDAGQFIQTLELKASFLRPAQPGRLRGSGRVTHRDGDLAFLEGTLRDERDNVVATATATARVIALPG
jgi:uncharacterized protein (TIGR00369 family)